MAYRFAADKTKYLTQLAGAGGQVLNPENGTFSAAAWLKVDTKSADMTACGRQGDSGGFSDRWMLGIDAGGTKFGCFMLLASGGGLAAASTTTPTSAGGWYHVAMTNSAASGGGGGDLKIYVNGTLEGTTSTGSYPHDGLSPHDFFIGRTAGSGGRPWSGDIAEVSFWKGPVLTADEVATLARGVNAMRMARMPTNHFPLWGAGDPEIDVASGVPFNLDVVGSPTVLDVHAPVGPPFSQALAQYPGTA